VALVINSKKVTGCLMCYNQTSVSAVMVERIRLTGYKAGSRVMFSMFGSNRTAVSQIVKFGGGEPNLNRTLRTL